jgi:hypothetical protein
LFFALMIRAFAEVPWSRIRARAARRALLRLMATVMA